jgi:hypothetical protein
MRTHRLLPHAQALLVPFSLTATASVTSSMTICCVVEVSGSMVEISWWVSVETGIRAVVDNCLNKSKKKYSAPSIYGFFFDNLNDF